MGLVVLGFLAGTYFGSSLETATRKPTDDTATEPKKPASGQVFAPRPSLPQNPLEENWGEPFDPKGRAPAPSLALEASSEPKAKPKPSGYYSVQVGAFKVRSQAEAMAKRLRQNGFEPFLERYNARDGLWYRVRTGRFENSKKAKAFLGKVRASFKEAYVAKIEDETAIEEVD
jgi:cell division septation protein DedD